MPRPPVPGDVIRRWRASGAWTGETLLDRLRAEPRAGVITDGVRLLDGPALHGAVERLAAGLHHELGVRPGDVVAFQLPNWWETVVLAWAILRVGGVASPITPTLGAREVGHILRQTDARAVFVPKRFRGVDYPALVDRTGWNGRLVVVRSPDDDRWPALLSARGLAPDPGIAADQLAAVLWTSGSTAEPKGVLHTHEGLRCEADTIAAAHAFDPSDVQLVPMPVTHVAGFTYGVLLPVCCGAAAVLMDAWNPSVALHLIARDRVTVMISTPVFVRTMVDHPDFASTDTSSIRLLSLGGAGVAPATVREGAARFGRPRRGCWCKRTYGSTEYPTLTTGRFGDDPERAATTDGVVIGDGELRIVDPATGADVVPGAVGELWCRGPEMLTGYLDPALDTAAFAPDGWFRTGDLARLDGEYLVVVDRLKDVIIRGGENISAVEVESLLLEHPGVGDCAVVAAPDPTMGERACAYVVPADPAAPPSLEELAAFLRAAGLARFKVPERLELRDALPRTASGKVHKESLRAEQRHERR